MINCFGTFATNEELVNRNGHIYELDFGEYFGDKLSPSKTTRS